MVTRLAFFEAAYFFILQGFLNQFIRPFIAIQRQVLNLSHEVMVQANRKCFRGFALFVLGMRQDFTAWVLYSQISSAERLSAIVTGG
jgi:hypothetical protein